MFRCASVLDDGPEPRALGFRNRVKGPTMLRHYKDQFVDKMYEDRITKVELYLAKQEDTGDPLYALHVWRRYRVYTELGNPILEGDMCTRYDIGNASIFLNPNGYFKYYGLPPATSSTMLHACHLCDDKAVAVCAEDRTKHAARYEHGEDEYDLMKNYKGLGDLISMFKEKEVDGIEKLRDPLIKIIMFMCNVDGEENEKQISQMIDMGMPIEDIIC